MVPVRRGLRSTLWQCPASGRRGRQYHDTGAWHGAEPVYSGSRCPRIQASDMVLPAPPGYLRHAKDVLEGHPRSLADFVGRYGSELKRSTAWCYVCLAVERWPRLHAPARALVAPWLLAAVQALPAEQRCGPLRSVLEVLTAEHGPLGNDWEWRLLEDAYAQLRLCRICLDAARLSHV